MKKHQLKLIDIIVKNLPEEKQVSKINSVLSGEDAILAGTNEIDGKEVNPEKEYTVTNHLIIPVNHKLRMKRAFSKLGKKGLIAYCKKFIKGDSLKVEEAINMAF